MPSSKEYYKQYRRAERDIKRGNREDMIDDRSEIKFKSGDISIEEFEEFYKSKLENKEQEYIFNNCLDLIVLISDSKKTLEEEGVYIKNATGVIKVNPAQKELRENIKAFTNLLGVLHNLIEPGEREIKTENRFNKFVK